MISLSYFPVRKPSSLKLSSLKLSSITKIVCSQRLVNHYSDISCFLAFGLFCFFEYVIRDSGRSRPAGSDFPIQKLVQNFNSGPVDIGDPGSGRNVASLKGKCFENGKGRPRLFCPQALIVFAKAVVAVPSGLLLLGGFRQGALLLFLLTLRSS